MRTACISEARASSRRRELGREAIEAGRAVALNDRDALAAASRWEYWLWAFPTSTAFTISKDSPPPPPPRYRHHNHRSNPNKHQCTTSTTTTSTTTTSISNSSTTTISSSVPFPPATHTSTNKQPPYNTPLLPRHTQPLADRRLTRFCLCDRPLPSKTTSTLPPPLSRVHRENLLCKFDCADPFGRPFLCLPASCLLSPACLPARPPACLPASHLTYPNTAIANRYHKLLPASPNHRRRHQTCSSSTYIHSHFSAARRLVHPRSSQQRSVAPPTHPHHRCTQLGPTNPKSAAAAAAAGTLRKPGRPRPTRREINKDQGRVAILVPLLRTLNRQRPTNSEPPTPHELANTSRRHLRLPASASASRLDAPAIAIV